MADINHIDEYLLFDFPTVRTDVGIILGTRGVSGTLARAAGKLYAQGVFNRIIICGGMKVFQPSLLFALSASGIKGNAPAMDFLSMTAEADTFIKFYALTTSPNPPSCISTANRRILRKISVSSLRPSMITPFRRQRSSPPPITNGALLKPVRLRFRL